MSRSTIQRVERDLFESGLNDMIRSLSIGAPPASPVPAKAMRAEGCKNGAASFIKQLLALASIVGTVLLKECGFKIDYSFALSNIVGCATTSIALMCTASAALL
jgi:hypothetical protein